MTTLSSRTVGFLVDVAQEAFTRDELGTLLLRADLGQDRYLDRASGGTSKHGLVRGPLRGAQDLARRGDADAHRALLDFVRLIVEEAVPDPEERPTRWFAQLREHLLGDGFELAWDEESTSDWRGSRRTVTYRILPTESGPIPLANEISALERDLQLRGYTVAANHYRQAVNNFGDHQYEAANGALRAMFEGLVMSLAKDQTGYVGQGTAGEGGCAINHIIRSGNLPERDGGTMLKGLWQMTHTNGPHPGQSTADESRTRMQLVTATARFLLNHFPA